MSLAPMVRACALTIKVKGGALSAVQRPKGAILTDVLEPIRLGNPKIATNLSRKMVVDFGVPWNRATFTGNCVVPPRMASAFAK